MEAIGSFETSYCLRSVRLCNKDHTPQALMYLKYVQVDFTAEGSANWRAVVQKFRIEFYQQETFCIVLLLQYEFCVAACSLLWLYLFPAVSLSTFLKL
jgi:hypothetical protein